MDRSDFQTSGCQQNALQVPKPIVVLFYDKTKFLKLPLDSKCAQNVQRKQVTMTGLELCIVWHVKRDA